MLFYDVLLLSDIFLQLVSSYLLSFDFVEAYGQVVDAIHRQLIRRSEGLEQRYFRHIENKQAEFDIPPANSNCLPQIPLMPGKIEMYIPVVHHKHIKVLLRVVLQHFI